MSGLFKPENIIRLKSVDSTNLFSLELLKKKLLPEGSIIISEEQTAGKGQNNAKWESEAGKNLTFSIILYPQFLAPENQFLLNKSIALGIADFVRSTFNNHNVTIKWPNDIYIEDKKVAGTLIINSIMSKHFEYSIIGIGININQEQFISDAPNPVSFINISKNFFDLEKSLEQLCSFIENRYSQLKNQKIKTIDEDYLNSLYQLNDTKKYLYKGKIIVGNITGVSEYGKLQISVNSEEMMETIECDVKELVYL